MKDTVESILYNSILKFVKNHLRITVDSQDDYLTDLIKGVIEGLELELSIFILKKNQLTIVKDINLISTSSINGYDCPNAIKLKLPDPFSNITSVKINDVEVKEYEVKNHFILIPLFQDLQYNSPEITIKVTADFGYNEGEIPSLLLLLIALLVLQVYDGCDEKNMKKIKELKGLYANEEIFLI